MKAMEKAKAVAEAKAMEEVQKAAETLEQSAAVQEKNMDAMQRMAVVQEEIMHWMATIDSSLKEIIWHLPRMTLEESALCPRGTPLPGVMPRLCLTICQSVKCLWKELLEVMEMDEDEDRGGGEGLWS